VPRPVRDQLQQQPGHELSVLMLNIEEQSAGCFVEPDVYFEDRFHEDSK
jgi:hypothetical protein